MSKPGFAPGSVNLAAQRRIPGPSVPAHRPGHHDEGNHPVTSNLTRDEAAVRSALITVASYHVDLDLTGGDEVFGSVCVIRFGCAAPGSTSTL